jgi:hypothetical protein
MGLIHDGADSTKSGIKDKKMNKKTLPVDTED